MDDKRNVTIYDIAKEAGVSPSMVSRVVSGNGNVSEKNKERVKELIERYQYRPNAVARGLQKKHTKMIGFMLPHILTEYFSRVYYEFDECASKHGYMTILCNGKSNEENELKLLQGLMEARVDAIVIMGGGLDKVPISQTYQDEIQKMAKMIPCICCTKQAELFGGIGVHADDELGARLLMEHLKEQEYHSMAVVGGSKAVFPSFDKKTYLMIYAKEYGIETRREWNIGNTFSEEDGYTSLKNILKQEVLPEVVCCINDHVALGALNAIKDAGFRVPEDIAVTGFDGVAASVLARPKITTVSVDYQRFGEKVFMEIHKKLSSEAYEELALLKPKLIIRESSLKKKG